ncbi:PAS domain S-box protein [Methanohalophilus mahii]|nr:PAS domain S-box protein [Methanohalophilus mahii]
MDSFLGHPGNLFGKSVFDIEIWPFTKKEIVESLENIPSKNEPTIYSIEDSAGEAYNFTAHYLNPALPDAPAFMVTLENHPFSENETEKFEDLLSIFTSGISEGIIIIQDEQIQFANRKFGTIVGKTWDEIKGTHFLDYFPIQYRRMLYKKYTKRIEKKIYREMTYEVELLSTSGKVTPFELSSSLVEYGNRPAVMVVFRDISAKKEAEEHLKEAEKKYRSIFEKTPIGIVYFDRKGRIRHSNEAFKSIFKSFIAEKAEPEIFDYIPDKEVSGEIKQVLSGNALSYRGEYEVNTQYSSKSIKITCNSLLLDGVLQGGIGIFEDISLQKSAESTLQMNKSRLEALLKLNQMEVFSFDEVARFALELIVEFTDSNRGYLCKVGLDGKTEKILYTPDTEDLESFVSGRIENLDFKDRKYNVLDAGKTVEIPIFENEQLEMVAGFSRNIAFKEMEKDQLELFIQDIWTTIKHKMAEKSLRDSENKYSSLVEKGNDAIVVIQDGKLKYANSMFCEFVDNDCDSIIDTDFKNYVAEEYRRMVAKKSQQYIQQKEMSHSRDEIELVTRNGKKIPVIVSTSVIDHEGKPAVMAFISDITQQKEKENELLETFKVLKVLQSVIRTSPAIVFFWAPEEDWPVEFVSENIENFGYRPEEFTSGKLQYGDIIHPSDLDYVHQKLAKYSDEGMSDYNLEYRIITKKGEVRWVEERGSIQYENSEISHYQGIILDITERKRVNRFLDIDTDIGNFLTPTGDMQEMFDQLLELALHIEGVDAGALYIVDKSSKDLNIVAHRNISDEFAENHSTIEKDSLRGKFLLVQYPVYKLYSEIYPFSKSKKGKENLLATAIIPVITNDNLSAVLFLGSHKNYEIPYSIRNSLETVANQIGSVLDRIEKEAGIQKSQYDLQVLFDTISEMIYVVDSEGCILYSNLNVSKTLKYSKQEITGMNFIKIHSHAQVLDAANAFNEALKGNKQQHLFTLMDKNNNLINVDTTMQKGEWNGSEVVVVVNRIVE